MDNNRTEPEPQDFGWEDHMRAGDFAAAWQISDEVLARRKHTPCWHLPRHLQYIWKGESLAGKRVLVRCYHGLGDTIQFIRYIPLLQKEAAQVRVWVQPKLIPLFQHLLFHTELFPLHDGSPEIVYDADIELMELPHYFRTTLHNMPPGPPYIKVQDPVFRARNPQLSVGLVWRSGDWDNSRSIPFDLVQVFANMPGITIYILQADAESAGWDGVSGKPAGGAHLLEDACTINSLDLVISVDTMVAHLAGAMDVPVWTLLPHRADWRWMNERTDSPWYPSMRLFRQQQPGDWQELLSRVQKKLAALVLSGRVQ